MTDPDEAVDRRLDANAAAGPLAELFTVDLTRPWPPAQGAETLRRWPRTRSTSTPPR
jgi:hypothetical protein